MLVGYLVLLFAVPAAATISVLGSLGRPSVLWGLGLAVWWLLSRLQRRVARLHPSAQPVLLAAGAFCVVALVSFSAAMFRGQPADQISPAITALVRTVSWGGVLLVAADGIRTREDVARVLRCLAFAGGCMALLGLVQVASGRSWLDWVAGIPGVSMDSSELIARGTFARAAGTSIHPLEFGTVVVASLPFALGAAASAGYRSSSVRRGAVWWVPVLVIIVASLVVISRSAVIGLVIAALASLPALPRWLRTWVVTVGSAAVLVVLVAVPRLFRTLEGLFVSAGNDSSTLSRTNALARVPDFVASSPLFGQGFGTFLPRYYIFDNSWILLLVELGILGAAAALATVVSAGCVAIAAAKRSADPVVKVMGKTLAASVLTIAVLFIFFDGLTFPMSAGYLVLLLGLCTAVRRIADSPSS